MCGRPEHHRQEDIRRAGQQYAGAIQMAEMDRRAQEERMLAFQTAANKQQQEALAAIAAASKAPVKVGGAESATTPIMRTKQKQATANLASLRINRTPGTNIGIGASGTNVG